jgi:hypothetical protein
MLPQAPIPDNLRQLVESRIAGLPKATRTALLAAAALRAPTVELVGLATGAQPSSSRRALERAAAVGVITVETSGVRFAHPLYAAVAYASPPPSERRLTHRRLARITVAIPEQGPGPQLAVLEPPGQVPSLLHHPHSRRTVGAAGQMDATAAHLDEEQHVEPGQPDRVDDEEVDRQQLVGVLTDEVAP